MYIVQDNITTDFDTAHIHASNTKTVYTSTTLKDNNRFVTVHIH